MADTSVTAVIPCFNHGRYVREAVDSVLGQTYRDLRVIVVDDGSTDPHTISVLETLQGDRVSVLRKANGHLSSARNAGIAATASPHIMTLDADDYFEPAFGEKACAVLDQAAGVGAVTCAIRFFGCRSGTYHPSGGDLSAFLVRNCARASALFRRQCWEAVGGYDETMKKGYEDWDFWIRMTARGWRVHALSEVLLNYRCAEVSMVVGADAIRPDLVRHLARKHGGLYRAHLDDVLYEKERQIQFLESRLDEMRSSIAYRLGRCFTEPLTVLRSGTRKLRGS
mgnify:CR=1 FL=1